MREFGLGTSAMVPPLRPFLSIDEQFVLFSMLGLAARHKTLSSQPTFKASCFPRVVGALDNAAQMSSARDSLGSR